MRILVRYLVGGLAVCLMLAVVPARAACCRITVTTTTCSPFQSGHYYVTTVSRCGVTFPVHRVVEGRLYVGSTVVDTKPEEEITRSGGGEWGCPDSENPSNFGAFDSWANSTVLANGTYQIKTQALLNTGGTATSLVETIQKTCP
jgi:hypothetical protein